MKDKPLWLWGLHACKAALANPHRHCFRLFLTKSIEKELEGPFPCPLRVVEPSALAALLPPGAVHQGIALETAPLPEPALPSSIEKGVLVVLDHVTDPQNVGAIIRTARSLGALGLMMTERHAPPLGGVVAKIASGALETLPIWRVTNLARTLEDLQKSGFWTLGLDEAGPTVLSAIDAPSQLALVLGAEGEGLRRLTREKCDFLAKLPTDPSFPTLNVSVAAAVALYEVMRSTR